MFTLIIIIYFILPSVSCADNVLVFIQNLTTHYIYMSQYDSYKLDTMYWLILTTCSSLTMFILFVLIDLIIKSCRRPRANVANTQIQNV